MIRTVDENYVDDVESESSLRDESDDDITWPCR